jgi:mRNA interferase MazF
VSGPIRRGDLYWVDWGAGRGSEQLGVRPALVVQNDVGNQHSPTTIVAAVTAQARTTYPFQVAVTAEESGLPRDSVVLLNQLQTVDQGRLRDRAGRLNAARMAQVDRALRVSLGLR